MSEPYDARIHITARELRSHRMVLPSSVPDRAWIERTAVSPRTMEKTVDGKTVYYLGADLKKPFVTEDGPVSGLLGPDGRAINDNPGGP